MKASQGPTGPLKGGPARKSIVFLPVGIHHITPRSLPEGVEIRVDESHGAQIAASLDRQLQEMRGRNVIPWFDFEHTRKAPASGYPTRLWWSPGEGVMVDVEWSGAGQKALEGRDVRYFSPEVYLNERGIPVELPKSGPIGGLVAEPAFREITAIAAAHAAGEEPETFEGEARKLITAGLAKSYGQAYAIIGRKRPELYERCQSQFRLPGCTAPRLVAAGSELKRPVTPPAAKLLETRIDREALKLIAAGEAKTEGEAIRVLMQRVPGLYDAYAAALFA